MRYYLILVFSILILVATTGCSSHSEEEIGSLVDYRNQIDTLFTQYENPPIAELQKQLPYDGNAYFNYYSDIQNKANKVKIDVKTATINLKSDKGQKAGMAIITAAQSLEDACQSVNTVIKNNQGHFTERDTARILTDAANNEKAEKKKLDDTIPVMRAAFKDN